MSAERSAAKERLEREWGDRYEQDAKDEASAVQKQEFTVHECPDCGRIEGEYPQARCCPGCGSQSDPIKVKVRRV